MSDRPKTTEYRLKVLAVDDEPGMRTGIVRALHSFVVNLPDIDGDIVFDTDMAETGKEALSKIESWDPDILLLDYKLPDITGLEILDRVTSDSETLLTIMITAYASLETAVSATKRGAYDFLAKPFTPAELRNTVRKAAGRLVLARQAKQLAEEKKQVRFQFIRVLAHEMKAPLGAIEGYLNIVRDKTAGDDPAVYDRMIERSLVRLTGMRKLITDLLDMTKIESGQMTRDIAQVDLVEIAHKSMETVLPDAREKSVTVNLHAPNSLPMTADEGEIEIILNNLLTNAVKYNKDGGSVDLTLARDSETVTLVVRDSGIGMAPQDAAKLFQDFVRIKNAKTRNILGSGLGLSIVKKLIDLYRGDVKVESQVDIGSTFTVHLHDARPGDAEAAEAVDEQA